MGQWAMADFWLTWWKNQPWLERGGCTPTPFHSSYHHVQNCSVRSSWDGRYAPPPHFISTPFCSLWSSLTCPFCILSSQAPNSAKICILYFCTHLAHPLLLSCIIHIACCGFVHLWSYLFLHISTTKKFLYSFSFTILLVIYTVFRSSEDDIIVNINFIACTVQ